MADKFPGDVDATSPGTTLQETLLFTSWILIKGSRWNRLKSYHRIHVEIRCEYGCKGNRK